MLKFVHYFNLKGSTIIGVSKGKKNFKMEKRLEKEIMTVRGGAHHSELSECTIR